MVIRLIPHLSVTFLKATISAFKKVTDRCGINLITIIGTGTCCGPEMIAP